ncbi:MAG: hypothetical protein HOV94_07285 [Saccharothrix sp.]|nr:hypothetical protein [Saccharothrix sp.]
MFALFTTLPSVVERDDCRFVGGATGGGDGGPAQRDPAGDSGGVGVVADLHPESFEQRTGELLGQLVDFDLHHGEGVEQGGVGRGQGVLFNLGEL